MGAIYKLGDYERDQAPVNTEESINGGSGKNRIYQIFKSVIELDELSLKADDTLNSEKIENLGSIRHPVIKINEYIISGTEIDSMVIDCTEFLPKITLQCTFVHQKFISQEMPKDGDIISVAIRNKSNILKSLRNDYVITAVVSQQNTTEVAGPSTLTFFGVLFIPWISSSKFNISYEGTSFEALKDLAEKTGLGFATNESNTDDKQIWISGYNTLGEYAKETAQQAWKDESSFYNVWVDIYYNLNFVNLNKQLLSSENEVDLAAWINNIDTDYTFKSNPDIAKDTAKVLSNYDGYKATSFYINYWKPHNRSTNVTYQVGTKINCHLFEHNENLFGDENSTKYWKIPMEPTYDPEKVDKYILLRGRATQDINSKGNDLARANYSYPDIYVKNPWMGVQYTISNPEDNSSQWDGNHHKNYLRAKLQNVINKKELEKLNVEVSVTGMNLNLIKGDKIPIALIQKDRMENAILNKESAGLDVLDQFYSGWYLIKGFVIKWNNDNINSMMSNFTQTFILTRREWPPPVAVDGIEKEKEKNTQ